MAPPSRTPFINTPNSRRGPSSSDVCAGLMILLSLLLALLRLCVV